MQAAAFAPFWKIASVVEWTVDASEPMSAAVATRIKWPEQNKEVNGLKAPAPSTQAPEQGSATQPPMPRESTVVTLKPMEIKTFVLGLQ